MDETGKEELIVGDVSRENAEDIERDDTLPGVEKKGDTWEDGIRFGARAANHYVGNSVALIKGYLELLKRPSLNDKTKEEYLKEVQRGITEVELRLNQFRGLHTPEVTEVGKNKDGTPRLQLDLDRSKDRHGNPLSSKRTD